MGSREEIDLTFGSSPNGAGRILSRIAAKKQYWGEDVKKRLRERGIYVMTNGIVSLAEELHKP